MDSHLVDISDSQENNMVLSLLQEEGSEQKISPKY
jgi:hypothetical protein